jgi:hypothetical protein
MERYMGIVLLLLRDVDKADYILYPDYPFNRLLADLRQGAGSSEAPCDAAS